MPTRDPWEAPPWREATTALLQACRLSQPDELASIVNVALRPVGANLTIYLVDQEQRVPRPLPEPGKPLPEPIPIEGTVAGRAFTGVRPVPGTGPDGASDRVWLPLVDGTERLGVVEAVPDLPHNAADPDPAVGRQTRHWFGPAAALSAAVSVSGSLCMVLGFPGWPRTGRC